MAKVVPLKPAHGRRKQPTAPDEVADVDDGGPDQFELKLAKLTRNDTGNAHRLIERHGADLLFVKDVGWHCWDGRRWNQKDGDRMAQLRAQQTAKSIYDEAKALDDEGPWDNETPGDFVERVTAHRKFASVSGNRNRLTAMLECAAPHLTVTVEDLDAQPFLFNTKSGTLELGELDRASGDVRVGLRRPRREDRISRRGGAAFRRRAECPTWQAFLDQVLPDEGKSKGVQGFLQRYFGYALTGLTTEQCLVLNWGGGSNGKSTFMEMMLEVFGDYGQVLPFASFQHDDRKRGGDATPDLAQLPGKRLVIAGEPPPGARLAENMIKSITGTDRQTARHLNKGFFEYQAQFKVSLSFNPKPTIRGTDQGIWRRIRLVPWLVTIEDEKQDKSLPEKLKAEVAGILNWLIDGYRDWREFGLRPPAAVIEATASYRAESDYVGQFILAACAKRPEATVTTAKLYAAYSAWCRKNSVEPLAPNGFGRQITNHGIEREKIGIMFYRGIELTAEGEELLAKRGDSGEPPADEQPPRERPPDYPPDRIEDGP